MEYSKWAPWSDCSATCGDGKKKRHRSCLPAPAIPCPGPLSATERCENRDCEAVFADWTTWTKCTKSCGNGDKMRIRRCLSSSTVPCREEDLKDQLQCNLGACQAEPGDWSQWSRCSKSCGNGEKTRTRECLTKSTVPCRAADLTNTIQCFLRACQAELGNWNQWSRCSASCGNGQKRRTRECLGSALLCFSSDLTNTRQCFEKECQAEFGDWTQWSRCSASCGNGEKTRTRTCLSQSTAPCQGQDLTNTVSCNEQQCRAKMSQWSNWSNCPVTCGTGQRTRSRTCSTANSILCTEALTQTEQCSAQPCRAQYGQWGGFGPCSNSCGRGTRTRQRACLSQQTVPCTEALTDQQQCEEPTQQQINAARVWKWDWGHRQTFNNWFEFECIGGVIKVDKAAHECDGRSPMINVKHRVDQRCDCRSKCQFTPGRGFFQIPAATCKRQKSWVSVKCVGGRAVSRHRQADGPQANK